MLKTYCLALLLIMNGALVLAQEQQPESKPDEKDYFDLSLEELMNIPIGVASKTELPIRESPGIISVITEQEIKNSGARDLIDVLSLVPGIQFGADVQGVAGIGIRGNWAYEGKVLILLDGQMMNEILYATFNLGNHIDVNNIDKVEVIRGPGSSIYGGFAELGVINIITKSGKKLAGGGGAIRYGQIKDTYGRRSASIALGNGTDDFEYSIKGFFSDGNRSGEKMFDSYEYSTTPIPLADNNIIKTNHVNGALRIKNFRVRLMYDEQKTETVVWFDSLLEKPTNMDFKSFLGELKYEAVVNDKLTITPKLNFISQAPWNTDGESDGELDFDMKARRINANLNFGFKPNEKIDIAAGFDSYFDYAKDKIRVFKENNKDEIGYQNYAGYVQSRFITPIMNITVGARYDNHSKFGSAFSPRIGLNKTIDKLHMKLLYSRAFRAPSIQNLNTELILEEDVVPEKTEVIEFEMGYLITSKMTLNANLYTITIKDPIVFTVLDVNDDGVDDEIYKNFPKAGTVGFETEYKFKDKWGYVTINYSYYAADKNKVVHYEVPQTSKSVLGHANSRITAYASFKVGKNFSINPSVFYTGKQYGQFGITPDEEAIINEIDPITNFNLYFNVNNLLTKNLTLGFGMFDVFDGGRLFVQPYDGGTFPMPGIGREFVVKLSYDFKWN
jgi:outer membrane receptor for ferrienterochelin and colicin